MGETNISSLQIQKLGHSLQEIRIRALTNIISKLEYVINKDITFSQYLELLKKLYEWFEFTPVVEEEKVLTLLTRILKSDTGPEIIKHVGSFALIRDLKEIRKKLNERFHPLVDNIIFTLESYEVKHHELQLICDIPLSFRSDESESNTENIKSAHSSKLCYSRRTHATENNVGSTATAICGVEKKSTSPSGVQSGQSIRSHSPSLISPLIDILSKSVPYINLNWQKLVKPDCLALKSVETSLQKPSEPQVLIYSCEFFTNVMLQDFPAEVFLQRPKILLILYDLIQTSPSTRITNAALNCLDKLTENLISRIRYHSDPCTYNMKPCTQIVTEPNIIPANKSDNAFQTCIYNMSCGDSGAEDTIELTQIDLPHYCIRSFLNVLTYMADKSQSFKDSANKKKSQAGVNIALSLINKLCNLTTLCIKPEIWNHHKDPTILDISTNLLRVFDKLGDVMEQYRLMAVATDMEYFERMAQLHLLHSSSTLLHYLIPITKADVILPRIIKSSLSTSLLDSSFSRLYPNLHESLVQYVNEFKGQNEMDYIAKYNDLKIVCRSMNTAVRLLKNGFTNLSIENLRLIKDSLPCFEFHKNLGLINYFLKICVKHTSFFNQDEISSKIIEDILLTLLSHPDDDIRKETYLLCQKLITTILGINHTKHLNETDAGSQTVFFFRPSIFIELASYGLTSSSPQIQAQAEDILIHILKCRFVVSDGVWRKLIKSLMPAMPILQCFANYETPLGNSIIKILDPDISKSLFIPAVDILKGNMRMLFCKDIKLRNEAVSRLCWMLSIQEDADTKIPKIKALDDSGLSNVFQVDYPIDLTKKKNTRFYQVSSLQQVIELLSTQNIEPNIRRSALTQISVMLEDFFMHSCFIEQNGLTLILEILDKSLRIDEYHNYPDSVIPAISVLKNICLFNATVRNELAYNPKVIFNILRALFLYCMDTRMQYDGGVLCLLLFYNEFIILQRVTDTAGFSVPDILSSRMRIPVKCHTHWKTSKFSTPSLLGFLMNDNWCKSTLRIHWNMEWYGGVTEIINWNNVPDIKSLTKEHLAEFSTDLRLTPVDLLSLKASCSRYCCEQYLYDIENATTHKNVLEAVRGVSGYIPLCLLSKKNNPHYLEDLANLPWSKAFNRFLVAPPQNEDDEILLLEILRCLKILLKLYTNTGKQCWITNLLQNTSHYLPKLLQIDVKNEQRVISLELLDLIAECSLSEQKLTDINIITGQKNRTENKNWIHIIQLITDNLKINDNEQFYNLAYLNRLLQCLVQITSVLGWSGNSENRKLYLILIDSLSELLTSLHYGKGSEAVSSFMGINITRSAILTLNHILYEMQNSIKNWEEYWVNDSGGCATLYNLFSLWSCRDIIVRAATLQLLSGIALSARGTTAIIENVRQKYGGVWETTLIILIDRNEASIVREHAAILLTNLCSHINTSTTGQISLPLCHAPSTVKQDANPTDALLILLNEYNFFEELDILLSYLFINPFFVPCMVPFFKPKSAENSARASGKISTESNESIHGNLHAFSTPGFVKTSAFFISNLLVLAPKKISASMADYGLVKSFFRCLTAPSLDIVDSKSFVLYTDTIEMCSAICSLLTRCIFVNSSCRLMILHTRDCLQVLISLLNPYLYNVEQAHFLFLRNQLWCEIFKFLTALINQNKDDPNNTECYHIISVLLNDCCHQTFFKSICESIESNSSGLQKSALQSLTSLLTIETILPVNTEQLNSFSFQSLLDNAKSPRNIEENIENMNPQYQTDTTQINSISEYYRGILGNIPKNKHSNEISKKKSITTVEKPVVIMGVDLCKILLKLYEVHNLEKNKDHKKKTVLMGALSSLLSTSEEAKKCALNEGFLCNIIAQLKNLHLQISLYSAEQVRHIAQRKKITPILQEVDKIFCLLTNFILGNTKVKETAADLGLANLIHQFWVWSNLDQSILENVLKLLCTFTTNCSQGCQSLTSTTSLPGAGPRKNVTNVSLLNAVISLISKEMDLISKSHNTNKLQYSFNILKNVCSNTECRMMLTKSTLLNGLYRLHPASTKRQKPWETVENIWLQFLEVFTFYPEGQVHLIKTADVLELILTLIYNTKSSNKLTALCVLRNVSFHHSNRIKLLSSVEFMRLLNDKLQFGTNQERTIAVSMIWALAANSQRSKVMIKCAGLDEKLLDLLKLYEMQGINDKFYQTTSYVYGILKEGEK